MSRVFLAYFDTLGFECVIDLTDYERKKIWAALSDKSGPNLPIGPMMMRAKANPQRFPEIWTFHSDLDLEDIISYTKDMPQEMANLIREHGSKVYVTPKQKETIK